MHRETGAYHKKFLGHNQKWLTQRKCDFITVNKKKFVIIKRKDDKGG